MVNGAGAGGGDLPAASTAGELLVSDGAGTDYTPTPRSDVVTDALVEMIGGEAEGSAIIADGAGDIRTVDANIAPFLAATSTADARDAIGAAATVTTTRGDLIRRGATADERVPLGTSGYVLTSDGTDPVWAAPAGGSDPVEDLPSPTTVIAYLRPDEIRGLDGAFAAVWPAAAGAPGYGAYQVINGTPQLWISPRANYPAFGTSGGVREIVFAGAHLGRMAVPFSPSVAATAFTLAVVLRNAQLTGTTAMSLGWGGNLNDQLVALGSRFNGASQWVCSTGVYQAPTDPAYAITSPSHPSSTARTLLLVRYDGSTLEFFVGTNAAAMASVGTRTVTLAVSDYRPLTLGGSASDSTQAYASTVSVIAIMAWSSELDDTDVAAVRTHAIAEGWL